MSELSTEIFGQAVDFTAQDPQTVAEETFDAFKVQALQIHGCS